MTSAGVAKAPISTSALCQVSSDLMVSPRTCPYCECCGSSGPIQRVKVSSRHDCSKSNGRIAFMPSECHARVPGLRDQREAQLHDEIRGVVLFLHALRLSWKAQHIRSNPIHVVARGLLETRFLPTKAGTVEAELATGRAGKFVARFAKGLNSCLTRSLVAGAILAYRDGIVLHVGFRPGNGVGAAHEGHAWLTLQGEYVNDPLDGQAQNGPFVESLRLPLRRS